MAAFLLIAGGSMALNKRPVGLRLLSAAWAFTLGMAWMSLAGNIQAGPDPARDGRVDGFYLGLIGLMMAMALVGLILAISAKDHS